MPTAPPCRAVTVEFSKKVTSSASRDSPETVSREMPYDGWITELFVGWQANANNAIGVQVARRSGEVIFPFNPEDHYIAADDFQHAFPVCEPVSEDDPFVAKYINTSSNDVFTNVVATVQEDLDGR